MTGSAPATFLDGLRVLDCSRVLAGPLAGQILADLGAEVLKVEPPWGDDTRAWGPPFQGEMAAYFQSANRGKTSLVLDLKRPTDRRRARELAARADVVLDNYRPTTRRALGLDADTLHQLAPGLVAASVVGYRGVRAEEPGYDLTLQAESGIMGITGPADGEPSKVGVAVVDVLTGMMTANGVLAALVRRGRTGEGAALTVSLFQTALFSLVNVAANHLVTGEPSRRWGNDHPNLVPYGAFRTADRPVVVGVGNDRQYRRLLALLGIDDPELAALDNAGRIEQRCRVIDAIGRRLGERRSEEVLAALDAAGIPAAPVLRPDEAIRRAASWDPQAVVAVEHSSLGTLRLPASPVGGDGVRSSHRPPPLLGEGGEELARRWMGSPPRRAGGR